MNSLRETEDLEIEMMDFVWIFGCLAFFAASFGIIRMFVHLQTEV